MIFLAFFALFLISKIFFESNIYINIYLNLIVIFINTLYSSKLINSIKTPLHCTPRIKRLHIISICLILLLHIFPLGPIISLIGLPLVVVGANIMNLYDKIKNNNYIHKAVEKLKLSKTKVIAITGSNGKTSVKNILYSLLSKKYHTQMTPKSYNTELGIAMFINNNLSTDCEYLILEYGARRKNDIKKLCSLFGADFGIITCVNPQHLETFKTINQVCAYTTSITLTQRKCTTLR